MRAKTWQRHTDDAGGDAGASAVEFALVLPLVFVILLGVIQYGYGLFQLQNFTSVVDNASKMAGTGIDTCSAFRSQVRSLAASSGIDSASVTSINVTWLSQDPGDKSRFLPSATPERLGLARVTATFRPFNLGFVPFPSTITRTQDSTVQDTGLLNGVC